jgi:hypothetical protein
LFNIPYSSKLDLDCKECIEAKLTNNISREITNKALNYLDKVVLDLCGPITPSTLTGYRYILFILDSATRFLCYKLLKNKSDALEAFTDFNLEAENQSSSKLKLLNQT